MLILSGLHAGHQGAGEAPGHGSVWGRHAALRLGVRRGTVDAHLKVVTAVCGHLAGVKHSTVGAIRPLGQTLSCDHMYVDDEELQG